MRVRVKICGITLPGDAAMTAAAGADALGLVFYPASPRAVDPGAAGEIAAAAGPFVNMVALFVNPHADEVWRVLGLMRPDLLQFHGNEPAPFCEQFGVPYIKVIGVADRAPGAVDLAAYPRARGLLIDTHDPLRHGGTGRAFDWSLMPAAARQPLVLAGGLDPDNVESAVLLVRPWAVDVSSGVELSPGRKDATKVEQFMRAVARANAALRGPSGEQ